MGAVAEPDSRNALAVGIERNDRSQRTGGSILHSGGIELTSTLLAAPGSDHAVCGESAADSDTKAPVLGQGLRLVMRWPFVNRGLGTGDLGSETGGLTWGFGEKPRIPCAFALRLMSPLLYH
jgi:hypothetical protein